MNAEMIAALRELEREKGIAFETILKGLEVHGDASPFLRAC